MKTRLVGILFILMSLLVVSVSAFVYEQASSTVTQTIVEVSNITLSPVALGNIEEGETIVYTEAEILSLVTSKDTVYLHFDTDLDGQSVYYANYQILVKISATSESGTPGTTVATLTIANPDTTSGVVLNGQGTWTFDFEITTTANSVNSDQATTVNIVVSAESTT